MKLLSRVRLFATPWTIARPPGSSIHGILQARILEWVAISFSRGSSRPRDRTQVSCIAGRCFNLWATREATWYLILLFYLLFAYIVKALNCELLSFLFKDKMALPPCYSPPLHNLKSPAANIWLTCQVGFRFMKTYQLNMVQRSWHWDVSCFVSCSFLGSSLHYACGWLLR